jgi:hypothetical protein
LSRNRKPKIDPRTLMHLAKPPKEVETVKLSASEKTALSALAMDDQRCKQAQQELTAKYQEIEKAIEATQARRLEIVAEIEAHYNVTNLATGWQFNGEQFFRPKEG